MKTPVLSFSNLCAACLTVFFATGASYGGESVLLKDERVVSDLQRVQVSLKAEGTLTAPAVGDAKEAPKAPVAATGWLTYQERLLALRPGTESEPRASISGRYYEAAKATMQIEGHEEVVDLKDGQKVVLARSTNKTNFTSAKVPLSQSELEMIMVPGNSLAAYHLLPGKSVSPGQTWEHTPQDLVSLLNLDEITVCEARSRLMSVENGLAKMRLVGNVLGNVNGAATELDIEGDYRFDMRWNRINWLSLVIKENRQSSSAAPGFTMSAELKMLVAPLKESPDLNAEALEAVARVYKNQERRLRFDSQMAGLQLLHGPDWKLINDRPRNTQFRMVDGGETIAQCNVRRLKTQEAGKRISLETFQEDIERALGEKFGEFVVAREFDRPDRYHVLQVGARGLAAEIPVQWIYYHFTSPDGECASLVYTMEVAAADRFVQQDQAMVDSLTLAPLQPAADEAPKAKSTTDVASPQPAGTKRF